MEETAMASKLNRMSDRLRCKHDIQESTDFFNQHTQMLFVECQYKLCNRLLFLKLDGPLLLLQIMRWYASRRFEDNTVLQLHATILPMLLLFTHLFDLPALLRRNPPILLLFAQDFCRGKTCWPPPSPRFESCKLLHLALENWDFESRTDGARTAQHVAAALVENFTPDETLDLTLSMILFLSTRPSTRHVIASEDLMRHASVLIQQALEARNPDVAKNGGHVEVMLQVVYNVVSGEQAGLLACVNSSAYRLIERVIEESVVPSEDDVDVFGDRHLEIALQIMDAIYAKHKNLKLMVESVNAMWHYYVAIVDYGSFSARMKEVSGKVLLHFLWLQSPGSRSNLGPCGLLTEIRRALQRLKEQQNVHLNLNVMRK